MQHLCDRSFRHSGPCQSARLSRTHEVCGRKKKTQTHMMDKQPSTHHVCLRNSPRTPWDEFYVTKLRSAPRAPGARGFPRCGGFWRAEASPPGRRPQHGRGKAEREAATEGTWNQRRGKGRVDSSPREKTKGRPGNLESKERSLKLFFLETWKWEGYSIHTNVLFGNLTEGVAAI